MLRATWQRLAHAPLGLAVACASAAAGGGRRGWHGTAAAAARGGSSARWLQRQARDPYVRRRVADNAPARSTYKLLQMRSHVAPHLRGGPVVELGSAPGGWTHALLSDLLPPAPKGAPPHRVICIDIEDMDEGLKADPRVLFIRHDFRSAAVLRRVRDALPGGATSLVLSDMSPSLCGDRATDRARFEQLNEAALAFAVRVLAPAGAFLTKLRRDGSELALKRLFERVFCHVRMLKPDASRADSAEMYMIGKRVRTHGDVAR